MELKELKEEIAKLEIDITTAPEPDRPIIQEEIDRLKLEAEKLEIVKPESVKAETALVVEDEEILRAAREATGESGRAKFPQAKTISVNNRSEEVEINGQKVTPRPEETFVISTKNKDSEGYTDTKLGPVLDCVILKVRYQIFSKYKVDPSYRSFEFGDTRHDIVRIFTGTFKNPQINFQGSYAQAKQEFATEEKDSMGNFKKTFDLYAMVYMIIDGQPYRFKSKLTMGNGLFDYLSSFGEHESYLGYQTKISLEGQEVSSNVKFWQPKFTRGEKVDLKFHLDLLKEINKYFDFIDGKTKQPNQSFEQPTLLDEPPVDNHSQPEPEEIRIEDIPF